MRMASACCSNQVPIPIRLWQDALQEASLQIQHQHTSKSAGLQDSHRLCVLMSESSRVLHAVLWSSAQKTPTLDDHPTLQASNGHYRERLVGQQPTIQETVKLPKLSIFALQGPANVGASEKLHEDSGTTRSLQFAAGREMVGFVVKGLGFMGLNPQPQSPQIKHLLWHFPAINARSATVTCTDTMMIRFIVQRELRPLLPPVLLAVLPWCTPGHKKEGR